MPQTQTLLLSTNVGAEARSKNGWLAKIRFSNFFPRNLLMIRIHRGVRDRFRFRKAEPACGDTERTPVHVTTANWSEYTGQPIGVQPRVQTTLV